MVWLKNLQGESTPTKGISALRFWLLFEAILLVITLLSFIDLDGLSPRKRTLKGGWKRQPTFWSWWLARSRSAFEGVDLYILPWHIHTTNCLDWYKQVMRDAIYTLFGFNWFYFFCIFKWKGQDSLVWMAVLADLSQSWRHRCGSDCCLWTATAICSCLSALFVAYQFTSLNMAWHEIYFSKALTRALTRQWKKTRVCQTEQVLWFYFNSHFDGTVVMRLA